MKEEKIKKEFNFHFAVGITLLIIIILIGIITFQASSKKSAKIQTSRDVALTCTSDMATRYHIHPELKIIINGVSQIISANIGIQPTCMTSIHTHDSSGVIHIEAPVQKDFVLGDFFTVWKKSFDKEHILDKTVDQNSTLTITVNGNLVDTYENTVLHDKDQIIITYTKK